MSRRKRNQLQTFSITQQRHQACACACRHSQTTNKDMFINKFIHLRVCFSFFFIIKRKGWRGHLNMKCRSVSELAPSSVDWPTTMQREERRPRFSSPRGVEIHCMIQPTETMKCVFPLVQYQRDVLNGHEHLEVKGETDVGQVRLRG